MTNAANSTSAPPEQRVGTLLDKVRSGNAFQRSRLEAAGVSSASQLHELPPVAKPDLIADQLAHPPFGANLTFPVDSYTHLHQTSGTTGQPLGVLCTADDWRWFSGGFASALRAAGISEQDRVALAFSFGPYVQFWAAYEAVRLIGAMSIPLGGMESLQRLETIRDYAATALVCTPTYALRLADVATQRGLESALEPVTRIVCTGEPGGSLPATRSRIEELWEARCFDHAGMAEVGPYGLPCGEHGGLHVDEDEYLCEILDPGGKAVPDGEHGELVLTALGRLGYPAIRYRTGDVVVSAPGPCPAGHGGRWLPKGIVGRADDMVVIRGMNVFPSAIESSLREAEVGAGEFRITFYTDRAAMDEVKLELELTEAASARPIQERMRRQLGLRVRVVPLRPGVLPRHAQKANRVVDERPARAAAGGS